MLWNSRQTRRDEVEKTFKQVPNEHAKVTLESVSSGFETESPGCRAQSCPRSDSRQFRQAVFEVKMRLKSIKQEDKNRSQKREAKIFEDVFNVH